MTYQTEYYREGQTARVTLWPQLEEAESDSEDETDGEEPAKQENNPRKASGCTILWTFTVQWGRRNHTKSSIMSF